MAVLEEMVSSLGAEAPILVEDLLQEEDHREEMAGVAGVAGADGVSNNLRKSNRNKNNLSKSYHSNNNSNIHHHRRHRHRRNNLWEISVMQSILKSTAITGLPLLAMLLQ